ncbi:lipopolysaccharide biosynthesis protein [Aquimarina pacifica]|uniref:lipopolysaccharide biosynthesis protein n=1 Tax=Aquimarina pacifica TaxID=1296415 RepID=UPI00047129E8|nr:lipopolysaccharide biosynthesis protein [Aquimarina pacifica]
MSVLKRKTTTGLIWSSIDKFSTLLMQFIFGIVLARILMPEDYGLIGMIAIFIAISQSLVDSGFYTALVQKKNASIKDYSTIFFFNLFVSLLLYIILFLCANPIANFYDEPILTDLIKVVAINIIIVSTTIVHRAILATKLNLRIVAIINITSTLISGFVGIYLAMNGYGVWSLVYQQLTRSVLSALLFWILHPWQLKVLFDVAAFKTLFGFGSNLMISELLKIFFKNLYLIVIGKIYKAEELGFYTRATLFKQVPGALVHTILQSVTFPVLIKVIDDDNKVKLLLVRSIKLTGFILCPIIVTLLFFSKPLILSLLTEKWLPTVVLLQILSIDIIFIPINYINLNFLNAKGRSDLFLKLELAKNIITIIVILATFNFGLVAMTIGYVVSSILGFLLNTHYTKKYISYSAYSQLRDLIPYMITSLLIGLISFYISSHFENVSIQLVLGSLLIGGMYLVISEVLKFKEWIEIKGILSNRLKFF